MWGRNADFGCRNSARHLRDPDKIEGLWEDAKQRDR